MNELKQLFVLGVFFFLGLATPNKTRAKDVCQEWFDESGIKPDSKNCIIDCDILPKDMGTFDCAEHCEKFCRAKKCEPDPYWEQKIKDGRPANWDLKTEVPSNWTVQEKKKLMELLARLPKQFKAVQFDGFYRMKESIVLTNPGTTAGAGDKIAIYDRAFKNPFHSTSQVIVHELAHVIFLRFKKSERRSYQDFLKWKINRDRSASRIGDFISSRAKDSIAEDFAENISYFLFEPARLRSTVPRAHEWISKTFSKDFKLKEGCPSEEK
jgi:hypothetical protein